jgi:hypothetical protein
MSSGKTAFLVAATLLAMPLIGADPATGTNVNFCLHGFGTPPLTKKGCEELGGTIHTSGKIAFAGSATSPILKGTLIETCDESKIGVWIEAGSENASKNASVTELSWSGSCKPCATVKASLLPYEAQFDAGLFPGLTSMIVTLTLSSCPLGISCQYGLGLVKLNLKIFSGGHSSWQFLADETLLLEKGNQTFCGAGITWKAGYTITSPSGGWFPFLT